MHAISNEAMNEIDRAISRVLYTAQVIQNDAEDMTVPDGSEVFQLDRQTGNRLSHFIYEQSRLINELQELFGKSFKNTVDPRA